MADVQLTVVDNGDTQVVIAQGENPAVVTSSPGPQGPPGPAGVVAATAPITYNSGTQTVSTSMATNRLLGRTSSGTGTAEEISIGTGLSLASGTLSNTGLATPGGVNTYVQFNDGGTLGGDVDLTWNKTTNVLSVGGDVNLTDGGTFTTTLQTVTPTANRTVSIPNATGTLALVAGSSGQLLYNNAGANAGVSTMTFDGTSVTLAGRLINSYTSLASSPAKVFTGTWFTGGTATTTKPHFLIEPSGATSTAWSTSGTGFGVNAASGFAGRLLDLQLNGTSNFNVDSTGRVSFPLGTTALPALYPGADTNTGIYSPGGDSLAIATNGTARIIIGQVGSGGTQINGTATTSYMGGAYNGFLAGTCGVNYGVDAIIAGAGGVQFSTGTIDTRDLVINRDAADILAQRRTTNAQTFRLYNTFTDASNYERGFLRWSSNVFEVGPEAAGTGTARPMRITAATLKLPNLPTYADNTAALAGGLVAGDVYKTAAGDLRITV